MGYNLDIHGGARGETYGGPTTASLLVSMQDNGCVPLSSEPREGPTAEERSRRAQAIARGSTLVQDAYLAAGIPWPSGVPETSYEELKELAYAEVP